MPIQPGPGLPAPLFPAFPPTTILPVYAWRAYTGPTQNIFSVVGGTIRPLSDIPSTIVAMIWYHRAPVETGDRNTYKTFDYGDVRPYTFRMPDGSTRINNTAMSQVAYTNLVSNIWTNDTYPVG